MITHNDFRPLSRRHRTAIAAAAVIASCASLSAVAGLFDSAGRTPWFAAEQVDLIAHCAPVRKATQRHACLHAVAHQAATARVAAR
jgi:hypothetical protein